METETKQTYGGKDLLEVIGSNLLYFGIGLIAIAAFLIGTSGLLLLVPGAALKVICMVGLGILCFIGFQWLAPEFTTGGTRAEVESDTKNIFDSIADIGKSVEFDLFGDSRRNKWLKEQKKKNESGYYKDKNGLEYYNAVQDKIYYQLPNGKWQDFETWNTPIDDPFEKSLWRSITSSNEITGNWEGTNNIHFPEVKNLNPEFNALFTMTLRNRNNLFDIGFKIDMENYLETVLKTYPDYFDSKDAIWTKFINGSKIGPTDYGKYYISMFDENIPLENILASCNLQINNENTKIKAVIPRNVFGISNADSLECILDKQ